jgi:NADP-dependent 3-hydroxy acid dehydrogenase YdfG
MSTLVAPQTLAGKVALVTGASSGIGCATALELARRGAKVIASARRRPEIEAVVAEINEEGFEGTAAMADINVEQDVIDLIAKTISTYGRIDIALQQCRHRGGLLALRRADQRDLRHDLQCERARRLLVNETRGQGHARARRWHDHQ